jgi:hypothetical protein
MNPRKVKFKQRKNCIICGNEIHRDTNGKNRKTRRKLTDVTCSHKCSITYERIQRYLRLRMIYKTKLPKALELIKRLCFVCDKKIFLMCGQPKVVIGGCCVGAEWIGKRWLFPRSAHISCYLNRKKKDKLFLSVKEVKKLLSKNNKNVI